MHKSPMSAGGARAIWVALTALVVAAAPGHAQDPAKGAALLAQARTAIGGADKLAAVKRLEVSGTFLRSTGPDQIIDGDFDVLLELPDKYRRNEVTGFAGATTDRIEALNGADVWDESSAGAPMGGGGFGGFGRGGGGGGGNRGGGGGFRGGGFPGGRQGTPPGGDAAQGQSGPQIDPARVREQLRRVREAEMLRLQLAWLLTTDAPVTWIGTAQAPEGTADVIEVRPPNGIPTRVFLEPTTHLPLMLTWEGAPPRGGGLGARATGGRGGTRGGGAAQGRRGEGAPPAAGEPSGQTTLEMHLGEYKAVNGIRFPHLITRGADGVTQEELKIKTFKVNPNFKNDTFTQ